MPAYDTLSRIIGEAGQARLQQPPSSSYNILSNVAADYFKNQQAKQEMMQKYIYEMQLQKAQTDRAMELEKYKQQAEQDMLQQNMQAFQTMNPGMMGGQPQQIQNKFSPEAISQLQGMNISQPQQPQQRQESPMIFNPFTKQPMANPLFQQQQERINKDLEAERKLKAPTIQQKNDLLNIKNQIQNLTEMETLAKKIPSGRLAGSISGLTSSLTGGGLETNTRLYLKNRPAYAVSLYRSLTGDTRLSDADAQARALPLLWHPTEDTKIRDDSFKNLKKALEARKRLIEKGQYQLGKDGEFITPLETVLSEAKNEQETNQQSDIKTQYNQLRSQGISAQEAKKRLGIQ
jgi:hypothetical protein